MLVKQESAEFQELRPSEHEDAPSSDDQKTSSIPKSIRLAECEGKEAVPLQLKEKYHVQGDCRWWALVPASFLALVAFCVGFAVLSLVVIAVMATSSAAGDSTSTTSSGILLCIGVISSVVGSLQTAAGYCAQRLAHQIDALSHYHHEAQATVTSERHHPLFYIGLLLLVCGTIAAIVNLGILGQSVTAPFAAMTLIFNGCLAFSVLHEAVTRYDVIATVLVLFGVGVAMLGVGLADLQQQKFELADIEEIFARSAFPALYSIVLLGSLLGSFIAVKKRRLQRKAPGLCCFSIGAGVLSGFSSLCVKWAVEVLKGATQHQSSDLGNPILYLFVIGIPMCVLSQLKLMTLGLEHFGTLKFVPPYHAFIILSNLINGMVYFDEASGYDALSAGLFLVGCAFTVGGVFVLLAKVPQASDTDEDHTVKLKHPVKVDIRHSAGGASTTSSSESELETPCSEDRSLSHVA